MRLYPLQESYSRTEGKSADLKNYLCNWRHLWEREDIKRMKPARSRSRNALTIGPEPGAAAQHEDVSERQGSPENQAANGETIARMAEFVSENPNIFEELGRYF